MRHSQRGPASLASRSRARLRRGRARRGAVDRVGAATLEFALGLPVLLAIFLGTVDSCAAIFVNQALALAAYEGSRAASKDAVQPPAVVQRCQEFLAARGIEATSVEVEDRQAPGIPWRKVVHVKVVAPANNVGFFLGKLFHDRVFESSFAMLKETNLN